MEKMKKISYVIWVLLPFLSVVIITLFLSKYVVFINDNYHFIKINFSDISISHPRRIAFIVLTIVFSAGIIIHNFRKEKEFAPKSMYGNYPYIMYLLAFFLGYKKIDLAMKPIPLQFKLLKANIFSYTDSSNLPEENIGYSVMHKGRVNSSTNRINIIVADTYEIDVDKLPKSQKKNPTIIIRRITKDKSRNFSQKLIDIIYKEVQSSKKYCKNYNLFLTTPGKVNQEIFNQIFQTGFRDGYVLYIYQQDSNNNFEFQDYPTKIKC